MGFVDGEVRRSVTQAGETADDVRGRFSERELRAARERLTDARRTGVLVNERAIRAADDDDDDDDHARRRSIENGDEARRTAWGFGGTAVPRDDAGPRAIRFGMGTTSTAQTPAAMLKRKAEAREAKIARTGASPRWIRPSCAASASKRGARRLASTQRRIASARFA